MEHDFQRVDLAMILRTRKEYFWWHTTTSCFGNIICDTDHGLFQLCIEPASTQMDSCLLDSCINHEGILSALSRQRLLNAVLESVEYTGVQIIYDAGPSESLMSFFSSHHLQSVPPVEFPLVVYKKKSPFAPAAPAA
jgi:hypothetical protein